MSSDRKQIEAKILKQIDRILSEASDALKPLQKIVDVLHHHFDYFDWTGIYLLDGDVLRLSAYRGAPSPHTEIPVGKGICGAAVAEKATLNIPDVNADPRYLACSLETKSEIVVPIMRGEKIWGEIDIDSHTPAAFSEADEIFLGRVADRIAEFLDGMN